MLIPTLNAFSFIVGFFMVIASRICKRFISSPHNHVTYITIHIYTWKHSQHNNDERTHFFRKIYFRHFIRNGCERVTKGLCVRGELETEQRLQHIDPSSSVFSGTSFSFCWAAQLGTLRAQPSAETGSHCLELQQLAPN